MNKYDEKMIPVAYILMIAENTAFRTASVSLLALIDNWHKCGKEWSEAWEDAGNE